MYWEFGYRYIKSCNFEIPNNLDDPNVKDDLLIFKNNNENEFENSMKSILEILD